MLPKTKMNIIMLLKVKPVDITMMTSDTTSLVNLDFSARTRRMKVAIQSQSASLTQLTTVKVQMEHGEDTQMNPTDTGSLMMMAQLATGSVKTAK